MRELLPPGQAKILTYFADADDAGRQPSRAEVAEAMGYAFPSAVSKHVDALVRKALLEADREKKRNVRITDKGWQALNRAPAKKGIPVIGAIAAGTPIAAIQQHAGYITDLMPNPGRFALQVRGDSMVNAGINDGDYAIIQNGEIADGVIGAVVVDGEATLKRVKFSADHIALISENTKYEPRLIPRDQGHTIQMVGPLCFIYRQF